MATLPLTDQKRKGTNPSKRGIGFCNRFNCRYCKLLNKTGSLTSNTSGRTYECMKKIACRSSNLIYCITCNRCGIQYVGQTSLRVKDRFVHHFYSVEKPDLTKVMGRHFSSLDHKGIDDMQISVLEFIKKPPKSPASVGIRDRVERKWMNLLRTTAPQGLNIED